MTPRDNVQANSILQGDSRDILKTLPDNHFAACVTDPPYELGFMGKAWDKTGIANDVGLWKEVLRVLKPGAHLLAFSGTRTYHRMACAIEDAGFEVRDQMQWLYGSGFPKSLDISKAIDKAAGVERKVTGTKAAGNGNRRGEGFNHEGSPEGLAVTAPATDEAKTWSGWGTALKPANEPICVARKPLSEKTVAANVLKWGTGALNIEASRIGTTGGRTNHTKCVGNTGTWVGNKSTGEITDNGGRWPTNVILDEEAGKVLDEQTGTLTSGANPTRRGSDKFQDAYGEFKGQRECVAHRGLDSGGASRFFYCAKATKQEREAVNNHPTVKPIKLIQYLVKLVNPPGGAVLDPFLGSGTTAFACRGIGVDWIGIDLDTEIARRRMEGYLL